MTFESAHHRFGNGVIKIEAKVMLPLENARYKNDWRGLKTLNERGDLILNEIDTEHIQYNMTWWQQYVLPMFNNKLP